MGAGGPSDFTGLEALGIPGLEPAPDRLELTDGGPADLSRGAALTVAATSASDDEARARRAAWPDALVEEMEGHAVAQACGRAGVPLAMLRAVSNRAGDRDKTNWDVPGALAALGRALTRVLDGSTASTGG